MDAPSTTLRCLPANCLPSTMISCNLSFSATLSASDRWPNASCTNTPASTGSSMVVHSPPSSGLADNSPTARLAASRTRSSNPSTNA